MSVFVRRAPPPAIESDIDNFELDHFKPKSDERFASLAADYYNLYYSCHVCNHYKGAS